MCNSPLGSTMQAAGGSYLTWALRADVGHLMHDDQVMLGIDSNLDVVADDAGAAGRHAARMLVTSHLVPSGKVGQTADKRRCKMGHQTPDNDPCRSHGQCYKSNDDEDGSCEAWSQPTQGR